jgi:N6-adenosine-specific RNA methylase IME4
MSDKLAILSEVERRLASIDRVDEAKAIRDQAEAIRIYAKSAKKGLGIQNRAAAIKILAERRAGELLAKVERVQGNRDGRKGLRSTLERSDIGLAQAHRWQRIATVPEAQIRKLEAECNEAKRELTSVAIIKTARDAQRQADVEAKCGRGPKAEEETCRVEDLAVLSARGRRFGVIYADPPWAYGNQGTRGATSDHYHTMTTDDIAALPVAGLAADDALLHLWTTNAFLFESKAVIESWGFKYKSCFVWVKPQMGMGNYWRVSHEFLLLGVRGRPAFGSRATMSWLELPRDEHSAKPERVRALVELVSPRPRLELFGRKVCEGWTVWGNEIRRNVFLEESEV